MVASACPVQCDVAAGYIGQAEAVCDDGTAALPGTMSFAGCRRPACPAQCGAWSAPYQAPAGANFTGLANSRRDGGAFVADAGRHVILRIRFAPSVGGSAEVSTIWGAVGQSGNLDGDAVLRARLNGPQGLALDDAEKVLYAADAGNGCVRSLRLLASPPWVTSAVRGLVEPRGLAIDRISRELFIAELGTGRVLRVLLAIFAGTAVSAASLAVVAGAGTLLAPSGLALSAATSELFVAEAGARRVLRVSLGAGAATAIGGGAASAGDGVRDRFEAVFGQPAALAVDEAGDTVTLLIADVAQRRAYAAEVPRSLSSCRQLGWDAASQGSPRVCGRSFADGGLMEGLCAPYAPPGLCCSGNVSLERATLWCDLQGARLCSAGELEADEAKEGHVQPTCMTGVSEHYNDYYDEIPIWTSTPCATRSTGEDGRFARPGARQWATNTPMVCLSAASGSAHVKCCADTADVMPVTGITPAGGVPAAWGGHAVFAGFPGAALAAIGVDPLGQRLLLAGGRTFAVVSWTVPRIVAAGDEGLMGVLNVPKGIAWDAAEARLFIADSGSNAVRWVDAADGTKAVRPLVGGAERASDSAEEGVPALTSHVLGPVGLSFNDSARQLYVSTGGHRVRRVDLDTGLIGTTINVAGARGVQGDGGPAALAKLSTPKGLTVHGQLLFVSDRDNHRVRLFYADRGILESAAGPVYVPSSVSYSGAGVVVYSIPTDPRVTAAVPPADYLEVAPVGVAANGHGEIVFVSEERTQAILRLNLTVRPRRVNPVQGTTGILLDPKSLLLTAAGTLLVADHTLHGIFAIEVPCSPSAGCVAQNLRRLAGDSGGLPGDGDNERRGWTTSTSTTTTATRTTTTTTTTELPCSGFLLGEAGEDCNAACARHGGVCNPRVAPAFDFSTIASATTRLLGVACARDARAWWEDAQPGVETDPTNRNYGACLGTWNLPATVDCAGIHSEYGTPSTTWHRWCLCSNEAACNAPTPAPSSGTSSAAPSSSTQAPTSSTTSSTQSPYRQECPLGYLAVTHPFVGQPTSLTLQDSAIGCAMLCEVTAGCMGFAYDGWTRGCGLRAANTYSYVQIGASSTGGVGGAVGGIEAVVTLSGDRRAEWRPGDALVVRQSAAASANFAGPWEVTSVSLTSTSGGTSTALAVRGARYGETSPSLATAVVAFSGKAVFRAYLDSALSSPPDVATCLRGVAASSPGDLIEEVMLADWLPASAPLSLPGAMAFDEGRGLLYFCDTGNDKVKVLSIARGKVFVAAGRPPTQPPLPRYSGDGGPARDATLWQPRGLALDLPGGVLYIADTNNHVIRRVRLTASRLTGIIDTVAGSNVAGSSENGGNRMWSRFRYPWGVALVAGSLYVADSSNNAVRRVDLADGGGVWRVAGDDGATESGDGGLALSAEVEDPQEVAVGGTNSRLLLFGERDRERLRQLDLVDGTIDTSVASYAIDTSVGEGLEGIVPRDYDADVAFPYDVAYVEDGDGGTLLTASYLHHRIRATHLRSGLTDTFAGRKLQQGYAGDGGLADVALLDTPTGLAVHAETGSVYIAESDGGRVRKVDWGTRIISTVKASVLGGSGGGRVYGLALDAANRNLYVSSPMLHAVYRLALSAAACAVPSNVPFAATPSCMEGSEIYIDRCTPACVEGYRPTESTLWCYGGVLTPTTFACEPAACRAPWGVVNAQPLPCAEGLDIPSGAHCTTLCTEGYVPSVARLACYAGNLTPTAFACAGDGATTEAPFWAQTTAATMSTSTSGVAGTVTPAGAAGAGGTASGQDPAAKVLATGFVAVLVSGSGLNVTEASWLGVTPLVRLPLRRALTTLMPLQEEDVQIKAVIVEEAGRRLDGQPHQRPPSPRRAQYSVHRYLIVYAVDALASQAAQDLAHVNGDTMARALEAANFAESLAEVAAHRYRMCAVPISPEGAPAQPCAEDLAMTPSGMSCTPRCTSPRQPSEVRLVCFAGLWSPPGFTCLAPAQATAPKNCVAPTGVVGARQPPCADMVRSSDLVASRCTPVCDEGFAPTEVALVCVDGDLIPSTFSCRPTTCDVPRDIPQAAVPPCVQGGSVGTGAMCTASCQTGYVPTANLTCDAGTLRPARFACVDAALASAGGAALSRFWSPAPSPPNAVGSTTGQPQAAASSGAEALAASSSNGWILPAAAAIGSVLVAMLLAVLLLVIVRRRRAMHSLKGPWDEPSILVSAVVSESIAEEAEDAASDDGNYKAAGPGVEGGDGLAPPIPEAPTCPEVAPFDEDWFPTNKSDISMLFASDDLDVAELFEVAREAARESRNAKFEALDSELAEALGDDDGDAPAGRGPQPPVALPAVPGERRAGPGGGRSAAVVAAEDGEVASDEEAHSPACAAIDSPSASWRRGAAAGKRAAAGGAGSPDGHPTPEPPPPRRRRRRPTPPLGNFGSAL